MKLVASVAVFVVGGLYCAGKSQEPYPANQEQGSSIGNNEFGHVRISHKVTIAKNGDFKYSFGFANRTNQEVRLDWKVLGDLFDNQIFVPPQDSSILFEDELPPVWMMSKIALSVRTKQGWKMVGAWMQKGPVPSKKVK